MSTIRILEYAVCIILLSASASELRSTLADSRCNIVRVRNRSFVDFHCDLNCTLDNFTQWTYYKNSNNSRPIILHNGLPLSLNPAWSSSGISVNYNQTANYSVLKIEKVTINNTGIYECSVIHNADEDDGCKKQFCLTTDEEKTRFDSTTVRSRLTYNTAPSAAEDNRTLLLYGICGGCLALTVIVALAAVCYLKKSKDRLLSIGIYENKGRYQPDLFSARNSAEQRQDKGRADAVEMSGGGGGHVITNGAVYAEVIPLSQRVPVQHRSAAATATATDEVQPSAHGEVVEVSQYAEVVVIKSDKSNKSTRTRRSQDPPIYADIVHQQSTDNRLP